MQILMNRLIKPNYKDIRYYIKTTSLVSFRSNGKLQTFPLHMASGFYDRKRFILNGVVAVDKGTGVKHLLAHINNIHKLKDKNFRDGVDRRGNVVRTEQVSYDCYHTALLALEVKLNSELKEDGKMVVFERDKQNRVSSILIRIPINYAGELIEFKFVLELPKQGTKDIAAITSGFPNKSSSANLKRH